MAVQFFFTFSQLSNRFLTDNHISSFTLHKLNGFIPIDFVFLHNEGNDQKSTPFISFFALNKHIHFVIEGVIDELDGWDEVSGDERGLVAHESVVTTY